MKYRKSIIIAILMAVLVMILSSVGLTASARVVTIWTIGYSKGKISVEDGLKWIQRMAMNRYKEVQY